MFITRPVSCIALACALLAALPPPTLAVAPEVPVAGDGAYRGMWRVAWMWDADGDRIDDRLEARTRATPLDAIAAFGHVVPASAAVDLAPVNAGDPVRVVMDFDHHPTDADLAALAALGFASDYRATTVDSVTGSIAAGHLAEAAALPGVARVEMELTYRATNDVATRALKAEPSSTYADTVWDDFGIRGSGITVAILDTGVDDQQHESFTGKFACGYNALTQTETNPDDDNEHGTHVAGTAIGHGGNPSYPFGTNAGVAPAAKLVDVKVLDSSGSSTGSSLIKGVEWAGSNKVRCGISVISMSLGTLFSDDGTSSDAVAVNAAADEGIVPLAAAGNHETPLTDFGIGSPASADKAITVAAMNDKNTVTRTDDAIASFSNKGPRGSDGDADTQDEKKPEVATPGQNIRSATYNTASGYQDLSGTSMATPAMAGVVALMLQADPTLDWKDVEDIIIQTSQDYGSAGWDGTYGYGYADAYKAVEKARGGAVPNNPPTACFTHSESGATTSVDAACSTDSDGSIASYSWSWGDGSSAGSGRTASHTYAAGGAYTVTLTVTDDDGATAQKQASVTVSAPANQPPTACFTHSESGLATSVDGACSTDSDGSIASYSWSWGDGSSAGSGRTASHTYAAGGAYTVTLTVTDDDGATAQKQQSVSVTTDPDPGAITLSSGATKSDSIQGAGSEKFYKIQVPAGKSKLEVVLDGPTCGLLSCNPDLDLYVRKGARPTNSAYDCRPYEYDNDETCTMTNPAADWWYVRVYVDSGSSSASYTIKATYT